MNFNRSIHTPNIECPLKAFAKDGELWFGMEKPSLPLHKVSLSLTGDQKADVQVLVTSVKLKRTDIPFPSSLITFDDGEMEELLKILCIKECKLKEKCIFAALN